MAEYVTKQDLKEFGKELGKEIAEIVCRVLRDELREAKQQIIEAIKRNGIALDEARVFAV